MLRPAVADSRSNPRAISFDRAREEEMVYRVEEELEYLAEKVMENWKRSLRLLLGEKESFRIRDEEAQGSDCTAEESY